MSFLPIIAPQSHILILGTYPSPKSRETGFYYGHPQNRFWPLLAAVFGEAVPRTIEDKTALIVRHRLALWDNADTCTIVGAQDASIRDVVPNAIAQLCADYPIQRVLCNGNTSFNLYKKYNSERQPNLPVVCLPSTSPANAACSFAALVAAWTPYLQ